MLLPITLLIAVSIIGTLYPLTFAVFASSTAYLMSRSISSLLACSL
ncbi:MAG: hypothetical protein QXU29_01110 [Candidatus Nitrosocaldus sp.]